MGKSMIIYGFRLRFSRENQSIDGGWSPRLRWRAQTHQVRCMASGRHQSEPLRPRNAALPRGRGAERSNGMALGDSRSALKNAPKKQNLVGFGEFIWFMASNFCFNGLSKIVGGCTYKGINKGKKMDDTWCLMMDKIKLWTTGPVNFIMTQELSQLRWIGMDNIGWNMDETWWNMVKHRGPQRKIWLNEARKKVKRFRKINGWRL